MIYHEETNKFGERRMVRGPLSFWDRPLGLSGFLFVWGIVFLGVLVWRGLS